MIKQIIVISKFWVFIPGLWKCIYKLSNFSIRWFCDNPYRRDCTFQVPPSLYLSSVPPPPLYLTYPSFCTPVQYPYFSDPYLPPSLYLSALCPVSLPILCSLPVPSSLYLSSIPTNSLYLTCPSFSVPVPCPYQFSVPYLSLLLCTCPVCSLHIHWSLPVSTLLMSVSSVPTHSLYIYYLSHFLCTLPVPTLFM